MERHHTVRTWLAALATAVAMLAVACAPAPGGEAVDQSVDGPGGSVLPVSWWAPTVPGDVRFVGQTFTAGMTGELTRVSLRLTDGGAPTPLWVEVRTVPRGWVPCRTADGPCEMWGTLLAGSSPAAAGSWVDVPFAYPAQVTAGQQYLLLVRTTSTAPDPAGGVPDPGPAWGVAASGGDAYAGGIAAVTATPAPGAVEWAATGGDLVFRTWVRPAA